MSAAVDCDAQPMSRTYQYRKVMKPLLERKRRARINRCLDELKELMVGALQSEGENVAKLEKADVLELTVKYLRKLKMQNRLGAVDMSAVAGGMTLVPPPSASAPPAADRFKAGFTQCATEVGKCLSAIPGIDVGLGTRLMTHLGHCVNQLDVAAAAAAAAAAAVVVQPPKCPDTPPMSPADQRLEATHFAQQTRVPHAGLYLPRHQVSHHHHQYQASSAYLLTPVSADEEMSGSDKSVWRPW